MNDDFLSFDVRGDGRCLASGKSKYGSFSVEWEWNSTLKTWRLVSETLEACPPDPSEAAKNAPCCE